MVISDDLFLSNLIDVAGEYLPPGRATWVPPMYSRRVPSACDFDKKTLEFFYNMCYLKPNS